MSLLNRVFKTAGKKGWSVVDASPDGLFGVTVMAPLESGGKPSVARCGAIAGVGLDASTLAELGKVISVPDCPWVVPLDRKAYTIMVIEAPPVRQDEMEQSVRWAISTLIDYPIGDAAVAWMRIPTDKLLPNRPPHLYVVATRNEVVAAHREMFKEAKIPLLALDVQETAHRNLAALVAKPGEGVPLLAVGKRGVQFTITFQGELYLDRHVDENIFGSAADETVKERARERIVLQLQRSLDFVSRTLPFIDISRVMLAPMPEESELSAQIAENLPLPVEALDLSKVFDFSRTPELLRTENQANYFVALGAALRFMGKTS
jgi:MSHA biogenesis protein MshI